MKIMNSIIISTLLVILPVFQVLAADLSQQMEFMNQQLQQKIDGKINSSIQNRDFDRTQRLIVETPAVKTEQDNRLAGSKS